MDNVSVLAVGCIDFIEQLKRYAKGISFEPLVTIAHGPTHLESSRLIIYKPTPDGISPYNFFVENFSYNGKIFIKVKQNNSPLRALSLVLFENHHLYIQYYTIEGWKQNERRVCRSYTLYTEVPDECHAFKYREFERVTFRKNHPLVINIDTWDLSASEIGVRTLQIVRDVLLASWQPKFQRIFTSSYDCVGIDISGHVIKYHHRTRTITKRW